MFYYCSTRFSVVAVIIERNLFSTAGISVGKIKIHKFIVQFGRIHPCSSCTFVRTSGCNQMLWLIQTCLPMVLGWT